MRGKDIFYVLIILLIFTILLIVNFLVVGIENIKRNWPIYRCNPIVIPFAGVFGHDPASNMVYCVQSMQTEYMSYLLEPLYYGLSTVSSIGTSLMSDVQSIRKATGAMRGMNLTNFINVFSKFENIRIEFHRIMVKFKDVMSRMLGTLTVFLYIFIGGIDTGQSIVKGPIGKALDTICFHPNTILYLCGNQEKAIKDIKIGDKLIDGTIVEATMQIRPREHERMYTLWDDINKRNIWVTGSHYYYDKTYRKWQKVENHPKAVHQFEFNMSLIPHLCCLVTNNGTISIGNHLFSDWEYEE